ncbi:hypothetical protein [Candidatus Enterococcus clewellii]|uniref:Uncharacterized protein n=1 Tax=Candidatus Enterococcus clewellii TaxID=1834193 RepID=A0A242KA48_9ENTE|nr:hypothetical protein [Enterococcus sp. 9E7_DIV0242]OTP17420.1 hypothetical protein A5888_001558 [Enterococcus sp. 9E7_DIV0242]
MKRLSKAATVLLWSAGIICILGMAGVGLLEIRSTLCEVKSEIVTTVEEIHEEGQELKYTIKDEIQGFKNTIESFR